jgi:hypothetical protein
MSSLSTVGAIGHPLVSRCLLLDLTAKFPHFAVFRCPVRPETDRTTEDTENTEAKCNLMGIFSVFSVPSVVPILLINRSKFLSPLRFGNVSDLSGACAQTLHPNHWDCHFDRLRGQSRHAATEADIAVLPQSSVVTGSCFQRTRGTATRGFRVARPEVLRRAWLPLQARPRASRSLRACHTGACRPNS